jgi:hypothetical protein
MARNNVPKPLRSAQLAADDDFIGVAVIQLLAQHPTLFDCA